MPTKQTNKSKGQNKTANKKITSRNKAISTKNQNTSKDYMSAIVLFAVSVLLFALVLVPGESLWFLGHSFILGLSGYIFLCFPILLLYITFMNILENDHRNIKKKVILSISLIVLICTAIYTFRASNIPNIKDYFKILSQLYKEGVKGIGAGLFSGAFGVPLLCALGTVGARITISVLIFVNIMFLTFSVIVELISSAFSKGKLEKSTYSRGIEDNNLYSKRQKRKGEAVVQMSKFTKKRKENIDIDIELDDEEIKKQTKEQKAKKLKTAENKKDDDSGAVAAAAKYAQMQDKEMADKFAKDLEKAYNKETEKTQQHYNIPPVDLLQDSPEIKQKDIKQELETNGQMLVDTLKSFGVQTKVIDISRGPAVTRYELQPGAGVKISKITNLADDIALNLAATGVRIEAPIPGKAAVGIEVPNKYVQIVKMKEMIKSQAFNKAKSKITVALGRDIAGKVTLADLSAMPHLLIAGSTGSGKSVCINSLIVSLLYKATPDEVKFLMIDPKVVELGHYNAIPHLMVPVVTDPRKAAGALNWAVTEMIKRYKIFAEYNVRDLASYNKMVEMCDGRPPILRESEDEDSETDIVLEKLPQIVIIIDELADLMMVAPHEVEDSICRLAQMARAAGMHLVIATQRPSVDVITGIIKANIPSRIAFAVSSAIDSRTILDSGGAEKLLGRGDMLFSPIGVSKPLRVQGCFLSDKEIEAVVEFVKRGENQYDEEIIEEIEKNTIPEKTKDDEKDNSEKEDPMLDKAIECIVESGQASTSFLQRRLRLGYARAARLMDIMEEKGIVTPAEGSKPRKVLMSKQQYLEMSINNCDEDNQ